MGDAHKLEVAQFPVSGVVADKPAHFLVHKNGAKGNLDGKVSSRADSSKCIRFVSIAETILYVDHFAFGDGR